MDKYSTIVQWSDEDEGYIATVPELPGVSAFGETLEKATRELEIAKRLTLKVYHDDGCALPDPDKLREFSGQLRLRIPKSLHASLSAEARTEGVSLNSYIAHLLAKNNETLKLNRQINEVKRLIYNQMIDVNSLAATQQESNTFTFSSSVTPFAVATSTTPLKRAQ